MAEERPFITISLDLKDPPELDDFVNFFGAISSQFERYMRAAHPDIATDARFYVQEVRKGSIVADLFPGGFSDIIQIMDSVLIVTGFTGLAGRVILGYARGQWLKDTSKAELNDLYDTAKALA